jgi:hemerythrin superfamily protein
MGAADQTRARAAEQPNELVAAVLEDHADIQSLMNDVENSVGDRRQENFEQLVAKLAVHETAEEEVVHPLTRKVAGNETVVDQRLDEESKGKKALAELEKMGSGAPEFQAKFDHLRDEVLRHAENEEQKEHPLLASADEDQLARATTLFRGAQKIAPTHAHAHAPTGAVGNAVIGPFVAMVDRTRDAIRDVTKRNNMV